MQVEKYTEENGKAWDDFVVASKNGTFLLMRSFMDYHKHRFTDCSLMIYEKPHEPIALLPAHYDEATATVYTHRGLTYGGLILRKEVTGRKVIDVLKACLKWYAENLGAGWMEYKPIPYIYSAYPAEEDLYALFRAGATLTARAIASVVWRPERLPVTVKRRQGAAKAVRKGMAVEEMTEPNEDMVRTYWGILENVLYKHHAATPVHSADEMLLLMRRFPKEIRLFVVRKGERVVAGCVMFVTPRVAHVQYTAAEDEYRVERPLDLLFTYLIGERYAHIPYFDFGISTEDGGRVLNDGLLAQKESYGGRAVCYDVYRLPLVAEQIETM